MRYPNARIIVFCKAPEPGKVKTRLAKNIGEQAAARVHEYLARHCLAQLLSAGIAPLELYCAPDTRHDFFLWCHTELGIPLHQQVGADLGARMQHALRETLKSHSRVVLVGTDCPLLTADYVGMAMSGLEQADTVIGPAEDGGYVLLGLQSEQPVIFSDMPWGSSQVYDKTVARLSGKVMALEARWDVDYVEDLRRLRDVSDDIRLASGFRDYLQSLDLS